MFKTFVIIGTRPEAIKMAMLVNALRKEKNMKCVVCVTAQHRSMLDQVLEIFNIHPDYDLNIMQTNQQLASLTGNILQELQPILTEEKPDLVLVHGDTNTTLAGALAAFYNKIPVAHVEAGMRTGNIQLPFPEEANRLLTSRIASWHFAPTRLNVSNLRKEGVPAKHIIQTGNTVVDSLLHVAGKVRQLSAEATDARLIKLIQSRKRYILVTGHRRENFGEGFEDICMALQQLAKRNPDVTIVYPVHLNPQVKGPVEMHLGGIPNIILTKPLNYTDFVLLMKKCYLLLTDSGGIQEEGPALGKPVLVMRTVTERPEAVKAGTVILVGTHIKKIISETERLLNDPTIYRRMSKRTNPYGDGKASRRIVQWIKKHAATMHKRTKQ